MDLGLKDQVAIITGAGRGIGKAIALALASEGVDVVVADIDIDLAEDTARKIEFLNRKALPIKVDVSKEEEVEKMVEATIENFRKIDILVNNAGISLRKRNGTKTLIVEMPEEELNRVISINLKSVFICSKHVIPHMIKRGLGNIVNISSIAAKLTDLRIPSGSHYNATKAGISNFTTSLASEVAQYNIRVNAVAPHAIETEMCAHWSEEKRKSVVETIPLKRLGTPEDVAQALLFLVSDKASFITGEILDVNGGLLMD